MRLPYDTSLVLIRYGIIFIMDSTSLSSTNEIEQIPVENPPEPKQENRRTAIILGVILFLVLAGTITALVFLLHPNTDEAYVARLRDVFIIIMAFESVLISAVLVLLILQLARLINLLQHEIKPILDSTNETVSTLRGTTTFISDHLSEPIIKLNEYLAGISRLVEILGLGKRKV
jgi:membrane protein implicated in regulation of membrane protease activity